jgi:hypothetical protein
MFPFYSYWWPDHGCNLQPVVLYSKQTTVFRLRVLYRGLYWEGNRKNRLKQSRDISLGIVIGLRPVCSFPGGGRRFFSLTQFLGKQCVISTLVLSGYRKRSFHVVKRPGREFTTRLHLKQSLKMSRTCAFRVVSLGWLLIKHTDNFYIYISLNFPCGQKITEGRNARSEKRLEVGIPPERQVSLFIRGTKLFTRFPKILRCNWISGSIHRTWGFAISFRSRHSLIHSLLARGYTHTRTDTRTDTQTHIQVCSVFYLIYAVVTRFPLLFMVYMNIYFVFYTCLTKVTA